MYTLKTFSMALTYAAVLKSKPRLYLFAVRIICCKGKILIYEYRFDYIKTLLQSMEDKQKKHQ